MTFKSLLLLFKVLALPTSATQHQLAPTDVLCKYRFLHSTHLRRNSRTLLQMLKKGVPLLHCIVETWPEALLMFSLALLSQVNMMEQHKRHAVLMLDEIQLTPGPAYVGRSLPWLTGAAPKMTLSRIPLYSCLMVSLRGRRKRLHVNSLGTLSVQLE